MPSGSRAFIEGMMVALLVAIAALSGGGPYETVDCHQFDGNDECGVVNGIADFVYVVDVASGLVTEITYVGGA